MSAGSSRRAAYSLSGRRGVVSNRRDSGAGDPIAGRVLSCEEVDTARTGAAREGSAVDADAPSPFRRGDAKTSNTD